MSITSSVLSTGATQKDGRIWVIETHTDQLGNKYIVPYLAAAGLDTSAVMVARATQISNDLAAAEIVTNITQVMNFGSAATVTFQQSTVAANAAALRAAYLTATGRQAVFIGAYLSTLTDAQLQAAFGMTAGQVTTLRTNKLTPAANLFASMTSTTGA